MNAEKNFSEYYQVSGKVSSVSRAGVGGLTVELLDKNVGQDTILMTGTTDTKGIYSFRFPATELQRLKKTAPDLQLRVLSGKNILGNSAVRYNASPFEMLNVLLSADASNALPSEYESLTQSLAVHYNGQLGELQETTERSDITFLANKTGWDARLIAKAAQADQLSRQVESQGIAAPFYYALIRAGMPANSAQLFKTDPATLTSIWTQAIQQGVVPASAADSVSKVVEQFQNQSARQYLTMPLAAGTSSMQDLLNAVNIKDTKQQETFAQLYAANSTDMDQFWKAVTGALGTEATASLQHAGRLAFLTLNNATLVSSLLQNVKGLSDPVQLVSAGYYLPDPWIQLLGDSRNIPAQIPGTTDAEKQKNYAEYLSTQLRLSYPTAAVADMVKKGTITLDSPEDVHSFLTAQQDQFDIGRQAVGQYVAKNKIQVADATLVQLKRLQRVYQMTPNDQATAGLLKNGLDSAYAIVKYDRNGFVQKMAGDLGGTDIALSVYNKARQIHGTVLNVAVSYLTAKKSIPLGNTPIPFFDNATNNKATNTQMKAAVSGGAMSPMDSGSGGGGQILQPQPILPTPENAADVIAYGSLQTLFGSIDYCSCDDCRSILSPAAYLVDLLIFIDMAAGGLDNAQTVLLERRPDIQYLPLTCENTNTALPYIDVVNETLEYYISNSVQLLSLLKYQGHDTGETSTEDLMASPQYVLDTAYTTLQQSFFPLGLPFHQPLENLRRYFNNFSFPLAAAMENLRITDNLERGANVYGWRDILMEETGLSREEYRLLTDSTLTLAMIYGFDHGETDAVISDTLSNAKGYADRLGIQYADLVSIVKTQFINPNSNLIPKLESLQVSFGAIQSLQNGTMTPAAFLALLPTGAGAPDPAEYGGNIVNWLTDPTNFANIMSIITLSDPTNTLTGCNFGNLELRFSKPVANASDLSTRLGVTEFTRLLRFIRLWLKMEWTVEQTDTVICSLFRADLKSIQSTDMDTVPKLDTGFLVLLPRIGVITQLLSDMSWDFNKEILPLLSCWSDIGIHGDSSLYSQMFLNPAVLKQDPVFQDNGYGEYLVTAGVLLKDHAEAVRGAFNLTGDEYDQILVALGFSDTTLLSVANISMIFRRGWLARKLRISVRELLLFISFSGVDPFSAPDIGALPNPEPPIRRFVSFIEIIKSVSLKTEVVLYLIWNQDLSGRSAPTPDQVLQFARTLRGDFSDIDDQFAAVQDPNGDVLRARMTIVYGQEISDSFFALLDNTIVLDTSYTNPTPALDPAIVAADSHLGYDDFQHRLTQTGLLDLATSNTLKGIGGVSGDFITAVGILFSASQDAIASFFSLHPELKPLYDSYVASPLPPDQKRTALLAAFQPTLAALRKREQAVQRLSAAAVLDLTGTQQLVDPGAAPFPISSFSDPAKPAMDDIIALQTPGLAVQFFFRNTATGAVDQAITAAGNLDYAATNGNPLPANPTPGNPISGIWQGMIEIPDAGYYNFVIQSETGSSVALQFDNQNQPLIQNGTTWRNMNTLQLKGSVLYPITITVQNVVNAVSINWETPKTAREVIPGRYLYPPSIMAPFTAVYTRFLKSAAFISALGFTTAELIYFANSNDYLIGGAGWLNSLPVSGDPSAATAAALLDPLLGLLHYAQIKTQLNITDESLLAVLLDPVTTTSSAHAVLFALTNWDITSFNYMLTAFGYTTADLVHFNRFLRIYNAFQPIQTIGIPAIKLVAATTNEPDGGIVKNFQAALRARYNSDDWRNVIQPINQQMRSLQRDALVAYILHQMQENPASAQINSADKLFEYFLMDVQTEPCMQTSRIRHALSSIQLFIERCLLNLEPRVGPLTDEQKAQWVWRKRYRVWQANREVFLFPENWLEPELRDDKSEIFKQIETILLQNEITDEAAESALLNYFTGLAEVAKLEPCGMFLQENADGMGSTVVHAVARSSGAIRKYFCRKLEEGSWTPWEQIKLDIEDNPVIPVVWNNRLLLFWLRILKQTPLTLPDTPTHPVSSDGTEPTLANAKLSDLKTDAKNNAAVNVVADYQAFLCWSEYYNGKWQPVMTSDVNNPVDLGSFQVQGDVVFDRSECSLFSDEPVPGEEQLRISVFNGEDGSGAFVLYNTHSIPDLAYPDSTPPGKTRFLATMVPTLSLQYGNNSDPSIFFTRDVLLDEVRISKAVQPNHVVSNIWDAPFFFSDSKGAFYVTSAEQQVTVSTYTGFGWVYNPGASLHVKIPGVVMEKPPLIIPRDWGDGGLVNPGTDNINPAITQKYITEDAYITQGIASGASVQYGNTRIGPSGAINQSINEIQ